MARMIHPFYNVSRVVPGIRSPLPNTDVMLIQYMLFHSLVQPGPSFNINGFGALPLQAGFDIGAEAIFPHDGVYKPELDIWIKFFQIVANAQGLGPLVQDGRINKSPVGWGLQSRGKAVKWYTIQALNLQLSRTSIRPFAEFAQFSDVPAPLAAELNLVRLPDSGE